MRPLTLLLPAFMVISMIPARAQDDTLYQRDSVIETVEGECNRQFFTTIERIADPSRVFVTGRDRRSSSLSSFLEKNLMNRESLEIGLNDLDADGSKELLISNHTGGAHCCDEIYIFRNTGASKYRYVAKTSGGHACFRDKQLLYSFYEHFGDFFTCYACGYPDTSDTGPLPVTSIRLEYRSGKLRVIPGDTELRSMIRDNLSKLSEQPYEKIEGPSPDNGLRKEFALNLAVFYYSFGRSITSTRNLFNQYYKFPDAKRVWAEFYRSLVHMRKTNDF